MVLWYILMGWQWQELEDMQIICISLQIDNMPAPHHSIFYRPGALPDALPTVKALKAKKQSFIK